MDPTANSHEYPSPLTSEGLAPSTRGAFAGEAFTPPVVPTAEDVRSTYERTQAALMAQGPRCDLPVPIPPDRRAIEVGGVMQETEPCCLPAGHDGGHSVLRLAAVDGTDALVAVVIRPHPSDPRRVVVDANAHGADKAQAADWLRQIAESWDPFRPEDGPTPGGPLPEAPGTLAARADRH